MGLTQDAPADAGLDESLEDGAKGARAQLAKGDEEGVGADAPAADSSRGEFGDASMSIWVIPIMGSYLLRHKVVRPAVFGLPATTRPITLHTH